MSERMTSVCASCLSLWDAFAIAERRSSSSRRAAFLFVRSRTCMASLAVSPRIILQMRFAFLGAMRTAWREAFIGFGLGFWLGFGKDYLAGAALAGAAPAAAGAAPAAATPFAWESAILPPCPLNFVVPEDSPSL